MLNEFGLIATRVQPVINNKYRFCRKLFGDEFDESFITSIIIFVDASLPETRFVPFTWKNWNIQLWYFGVTHFRKTVVGSLADSTCDDSDVGEVFHFVVGVENSHVPVLLVLNLHVVDSYADS